MEEQKQNPKKLKSPIINFLAKSLSSLCSGSLFSTIITLYALILLYFPSLFFHIIFSPVFISTGILLLALLRLGALQRTTQCDSHSPTQTPPESNSLIQQQDDSKKVKPAPPNTKSGEPLSTSDSGPGPDLKPYYSDSFREWNVRAPLEVIYEEYGEGEDDDTDDGEDDRTVVDGGAAVFNEKVERRVMGNEERYPISLSMYYPESDGDSSSEDDGDYAAFGNWESAEEDAFFKWNEEDREELIEIALDNNHGKRRNCGDDDCNVVENEEDNLIEIDIFPGEGLTGFPAGNRYR